MEALQVTSQEQFLLKYVGKMFVFMSMLLKIRHFVGLDIILLEFEKISIQEHPYPTI